MNQAASHLAGSKAPQGFVQNGRFLLAGGRWGKKVEAKDKKTLSQARSPTLEEGDGRSLRQTLETDYLTGSD